FTVAVIDDGLLEANTETVIATISNPSNGSVSISTASATANIIDDDSSSVTISDATIVEGGNLSFDVNLNMNVQGDVVVVVFFTNISTSDNDYDEQTQQVTFSGGTAGIETITLGTTGDLTLEADETFTASLSLNSGNTAITIGDAGLGTIIDNDTAAVTISDATIVEGGDLSFDVSLNQNVQGNVVVLVSFTNISTSDNDFTSSVQTITFVNGDSGIQTVTVPTTEDTQLESSETFTANLSLGSDNVNSAVITSATGIGTITNDDTAAVTIADASGNEDEGPIILTATLDFAVEGGFEVDVNTGDGTATTKGKDYTELKDQTLIFAGTEGETQNFSVIPTSDAILEEDETLNINMDNLSATILDVQITDQASLTILNDDGAANVTISDAQVTEGGDLSFDVTLDENVEGDVVIDVFFVNISTSDNDYNEANQQVTFSGGTPGTQTITLSTNDDLILEIDETFTASLSLNSGNPEVITSDTGIGTIIDDDDAAVLISDATIIEGGILSFDLTLDKNVQGDVVVDVSFTHVSTEATDFTTSTQQYIFSGGTAGTTTITVPTSEDTQVEPDETFTANLALGIGNINSEVVTSDTGIGTIINDDESTVVTILATDDNGQEGTPATNNAEFTVAISKVSAVATIVIYSVSGTATEGVDYTVLPGILSIPAGSLSSTIKINIIDDILFESSETVIVTLTEIFSNDLNTNLGMPLVATVSITDNDIDCYAGDDADICSSDNSYELSSASQTNANSFAWSTDGTGTFTDYEVLNAIYLPSDSDRDNGQVQLTLNVSGSSGTSSSAMLLKIWPAASVDVGVTTVMIKAGESYTLSGATAANYAGLIWTSTGGSFDDANALNPIFTPTTGDNVTLTLRAIGLGGGVCADAIDEILVLIDGAPIARDDQLDARDNEETVITVLDNDSYVDGDVLSVSILTDPEFGEVMVNEDGSLTYIADLGTYCNTDQFTYQICNTDGLCDEAVVNIEIGVMDSDEDSIPDAVESLIADTDSDFIPDHLDLDSDNDGLSDVEEAQVSDPCSDLPIDTDSDGIPDFRDLDSDNDGYSDEEEGNDDCDGDGVADYIDAFDDCSEQVSTPEGFSPNGDGVNEFLVFRGIKDFPNSKLIVFNRWGSIIYEAKGYQNNWYGIPKNKTAIGSDIVPEGTYYYIIDLGNGSKPIKGFVYINY
ncbi:Calx-beta domain-containing protein, partial [Ancylomarina sp. YFZ004]